MVEWDEDRAKMIASSKIKVQKIYDKVVKLPEFLDEALVGSDSTTGAQVYDIDKLSRLIGAHFDISENEAESRVQEIVEFYKDYFRKPILISTTNSKEN